MVSNLPTYGRYKISLSTYLGMPNVFNGNKALLFSNKTDTVQQIT